MDCFTLSLSLSWDSNSTWANALLPHLLYILQNTWNESFLNRLTCILLGLSGFVSLFGWSDVTSLTSEGKVGAAWSTRLPSPSAPGGGVQRR